MKLFNCQHCGQMLFFENRTCERCSRTLGYLPDLSTLSALEPEGDAWRALATMDGPFRFCSNAEYDACNWLVSTVSAETYCKACRHGHGLAFDFLDDPPAAAKPKVLTGHDEGVITLATKEADDVEREKMRTAMGEPYRTLLGHFRHEVGHHFWDILVRDGDQLETCRAVFGDDSQDYDQALKRHYQAGPPPDWPNRFISAYATAHPWEDFAETWAHYLHIVDTLESASAYGLRIHPDADRSGLLEARIDFDPYEEPRIQVIVDDWVPLTFAMNSLNRSMGLQDPYPFVLSPTVISKLGFIHQLVHGPRLP
jgi:hypothetical protein